MIPQRLTKIIENYGNNYKNEIESSYRLAAGALAKKLRGNGHTFV